MFLLLLLVAVGWWLLRGTPLSDRLGDMDWLRSWITQTHPLAGMALFVFGGGALTVIGFPRIVLSGLGGFVFGVWLGTALALVGTVWGCVLSFYIARLMGQGFVQDRLTGNVKKTERLLLRRPFLVSVLIRNLPLANNSVTNLLAGISSIRAIPYFAGSAIGYVPQTLVFALMGAGLQQDEFAHIVLSILVFLTMAGLMWYLARTFSGSDAASHA